MLKHVLDFWQSKCYAKYYSGILFLRGELSD